MVETGPSHAICNESTIVSFYIPRLDGQSHTVEGKKQLVFEPSLDNAHTQSYSLEFIVSARRFSVITNADRDAGGNAFLEHGGNVAWCTKGILRIILGGDVMLIFSSIDIWISQFTQYAVLMAAVGPLERGKIQSVNIRVVMVGGSSTIHLYAGLVIPVIIRRPP